MVHFSHGSMIRKTLFQIKSALEWNLMSHKMVLEKLLYFLCKEVHGFLESIHPCNTFITTSYVRCWALGGLIDTFSASLPKSRLRTTLYYPELSCSSATVCRILTMCADLRGTHKFPLVPRPVRGAWCIPSDYCLCVRVLYVI